MTTQPEAIAGVADVDCSETRALVTGSTSGIGRAAALALGRLGADVIVHGRDQEAGAAVVNELGALGSDGQFVRADFADPDAVRELAATVRRTTDGLDLLINNAGGFFRSGRLTDLGVEYTFHVNHLSPYLLTAELLDHLTAGSRIVTTASAAHQGTSLDLSRVQTLDEYSGMWAYSHSKLANILFSSELARRLDAADRDVVSNSIHPGAIPGSGFSRFLPGPIPRVLEALDGLPIVTSVAEGAAEILVPALSPRTATISGRYFSDQRPTQPSAPAQGTYAAQRLWNASADLLGIATPLAEGAE
ncbi:SDR family NAD(P)-dependent oxidoreductase [Halorubrum ezzemoulense]|uniref:SDR family NAD(P)-dependent oxidoreductase n=1 Tax=Halorubrum ezzemoulense TaxID=337243 RepID=UPI00232F5BA9|nr:SDR family NAD(P)-dependent oxidoreductase [Halorubrum ezzemoulense]MDB9251017.1 SDR family NAD(P)-dependent oxidoreductase [Halorubrum ezzemoulense]MDB9255426.1 SDR family NAD(P)-dependent oxidoreductase [Halorubrum ezzemoulense]MDB9276137.1 SDR family NAD(P)-dependent oxidoreductase [Halorubrum ezzemoulense]